MVYRVPGFMHVATYFAHMFFVPIQPLRSVVVIEDHEGKPIGQLPLPMNWISVVVGWSRGLLFFLGAMLLIFGLLSLDRPPDRMAGIVMLCAFPIFVALGWVTWRLPGISRASYERAAAILDSSSSALEWQVALQVRFGMLDSREACSMQEQTIAERRAEYEQRLAEVRLRPRPSQEEIDAAFGKAQGWRSWWKK